MKNTEKETKKRKTYISTTKKVFCKIQPHRLIISGYTESKDIKDAFEKY